MSIEIKDPETERVVRELAKRLNLEPTEVVRRGAEALAREDNDEEAAIERIVAEVRKLPVTDGRPIRELLGEEEPR